MYPENGASPNQVDTYVRRRDGRQTAGRLSGKWLWLVLVGTIVFASSSRAQISDPGIRDTVRVDSVSVAAGDRVAVPVLFYNDEELGGVEIVVFHSSAGLTFDSVSFVGSRISGVTNKGWLQRGDTLSIFCVPFPGSINPGSGVFATLHYSTSEGLIPQSIPIDTTTFLEGQSIHETFFSTNNAQTFFPSFRKGFVVVTGSCCRGSRGNANNDQNDAVTIADLTFLVSFLFLGGAFPACLPEGNVNGSSSDAPTIGDIAYLVNYLFNEGAAPHPCP